MSRRTTRKFENEQSHGSQPEQSSSKTTTSPNAVHGPVSIHRGCSDTEENGEGCNESEFPNMSRLTPSHSENSPSDSSLIRATSSTMESCEKGQLERSQDSTPHAHHDGDDNAVFSPPPPSVRNRTLSGNYRNNDPHSQNVLFPTISQVTSFGADAAPSPSTSLMPSSSIEMMGSMSDTIRSTDLRQRPQASSSSTKKQIEQFSPFVGQTEKNSREEKQIRENSIVFLAGEVRENTTSSFEENPDKILRSPKQESNDHQRHRQQERTVGNTTRQHKGRRIGMFRPRRLFGGRSSWWKRVRGGDVATDTGYNNGEEERVTTRNDTSQRSWSRGDDNDASTGVDINLGTVSDVSEGGSSAVDDDDDSSVAPIMGVMDRIEDEIDGHGYDDLIPLQVRLALEENVFGWSHLLADILGHIFFTGAAFFLTYQVVTFLLLRKTSDDEAVGGSASSSSPCDGAFGCFFYHIAHLFQKKGVPFQGDSDPLDANPSKGSTSQTESGDTEGESSSTYNTSATGSYEYTPVFGMSYNTFVTLRFILSSLSAISAFRTVRRRRRVWLPAPYGSREYMNDAQRRQRDVEETDRTTVLGRIRSSKNALLAMNVRRKLRKAGDRFERRHRRAVRLLGSRYHHHGSLTPDHHHHHHHRVRVLAESGHIVKGRRKGTRRRRSRGEDESSFRGVSYHIVDDGKASEQDERDIFTKREFAVESVAHDQIPFTFIYNVPYAHGGFFGAAPFMLANPSWIEILRNLMPDVYVEISRRAVYAPAPKLIHWAENNPVVAAYGTAHELEQNGKISTLEWDVFLDPHLVKRLEIVLDEREKFLRRCTTRNGFANAFSSFVAGSTSAVLPRAAAVAVTSPSERNILQYYDVEIRRRTKVLVERMLIAHGNLTQLILEQTGFAKQYNFSRVKRTRRTLGGGIFARQWLAVYAEALRLRMGWGDDTEVVVDGATVEKMGKAQNEDVLFMSDKYDKLSFPFDPPNSPEASRSRFMTSETYSSTSSPSSSRTVSDEEVDSEELPLLPDELSFDSENDENFVLRPGRISECNSLEGRSQSRSPSPNYKPMSRIVFNADDSDTGRDNRNNKDYGRKSSKGFGEDNRSGTGKRLDKPEENIAAPPIAAGIYQGQQFQTASSFRQRDSWAIKNTPKHVTSLNALALSKCPNTSIPHSIRLLKKILDCNAPLGLVLDIKSRHVPKRIWAIIVDALRDAGARVEGVASFTVDEIRDMSQYCSSPVKEILFFHSAGDLQQACHKGQINRGDCVFFNGGSLLWNKPEWKDEKVCQAAARTRCLVEFSAEEVKKQYELLSYARVVRPYKEEKNNADSDASLSDEGSNATSPFTSLLHADSSDCSSQDGSGSTIQHYKDCYGLSIGLYLQEFAIDEAAVDLLAKHVNENPHIYDLGLSWGGVNGITVRGIQPGRFTNTDGLWNQRYAGAAWDVTLFPPPAPEGRGHFS